MDPLLRHNARVTGRGGRPLVFAHGFGCDQAMWRLVAPAFEATHRVVLFDHAGHGGAHPAAFDPVRHATLRGYADDLLAVLGALGAPGAVVVGHSVGAMVGALAAIARPGPVAGLVMVGPSPRYVDDGDYVGGFSAEDVRGILDLVEQNPLGWGAALAPTVAGNPDRPEVAAELEQAFCRTEPAMAAHFARVTFLSDNRADLERVAVPTLVLQCSDDAIAPEAVGLYVHGRVGGSSYRKLAATGHCPQLSAPGETVAAIQAFLADRGLR